jgi:serine/threonine protein kinase
VVLVAIKVLREGTSPGQNNELLEEARIMASVVDPCCVHILAICMTAEIMLVSELMRHGCLLDYIHKNRDNISGRSLLLWSKQIAQVLLLSVVVNSLWW